MIGERECRSLNHKGWVVTTFKNVLEIAIRLELAFDRRFVDFEVSRQPGPELWIRSAVGLIRMNEEDNQYPKDPELFIALLSPEDFSGTDHNQILDQLLNSYAKRVRRIIRQLRHELSGELRFLLQERRRGSSLEDLIFSQKRAITPLSRYIFAHVNGRSDLAKRLIVHVIEQHKACPLYRHASRRWLSDLKYPLTSHPETWNLNSSTSVNGWDVTRN